MYDKAANSTPRPMLIIAPATKILAAVLKRGTFDFSANRLYAL